MKNDFADGKWTEIADLIHNRWGKFSKREVASLRNNLDDLSDLIQRVYGHARGHAELECHDFRVGLRPILLAARR